MIQKFYFSPKEDIVLFVLKIKQIHTDQNAGLWLSALICVFLFLLSL